MAMITPAPRTTAAFVGWFADGPMNRAIEVESFADVEEHFGGLHPESDASFNLWQYFRNGGTRAWVVGTNVGIDSVASGLSALTDCDFDLLCLRRILVNAVDYCREKNALLLLDPPASLSDPEALVAWLGTPAAPRGDQIAMYYPWLSIADPTRADQPRSVGPSGTIAGLMAAVDAAHGVWTAPAGTNAVLQGTLRLEHAVNEVQAATLNDAGVNCLRDLPGYGPVCWGARTLLKPGMDASPYSYVTVRRLANYIASSVTAGLSWALFEPNDEDLWSAVRTGIVDFMQELFVKGAFAGAVPSDAFFVKCDADTTSAADRAAGWLRAVVAFAPLRPAEFVVLRVGHLVGQSDE